MKHTAKTTVRVMVSEVAQQFLAEHRIRPRTLLTSDVTRLHTPHDK